ncbi:MAG: MerR family DNA-binding transcriptional regulator [Pseudomonadota bacterium]
MTETYMTIREMCDAFSVTPRTLRFYEAKELLNPERRGTKRLFTRRDRARLKLILKGKRFGFSLEDIRQLLDLYDPKQQNLPQMQRAYDLGRERLADLEARRAELEAIITDLKANLEWGAKLLADPRKTAAE